MVSFLFYSNYHTSLDATSGLDLRQGQGRLNYFPNMSYQVTQTLKQQALAASCIGYLVPAGARIDQKTDQNNKGLLLLIAIKI